MLRESSFQRSVCRIVAAAILFAQVIVSAYACPYTIGENDTTARNAVAAGSDVQPGRAASDCETTDQLAPAVSLQCAEHCRYGQQADQMQTVTVPAAALTCLYPAPMPVMMPDPAPSTKVDVAIAPSPPHSILHCCLRI